MDKNYVKTLVTPSPKSNDRKAWGLGVYSFWVPFFTASNVEGISNVAPEDLGAPVRLQIDETGMVKFDRNGRPRLPLKSPPS